MNTTSHQQGPIAWFVRNPIAANLLMILIIIAGLLGVGSIPREMTPKLSTNTIRATMEYPGATPMEVEEGIVKKIEVALADINGIERLVSSARENAASVELTVDANHEVEKVMDDVKQRVDAIKNFPKKAENLSIEHIDNAMKFPAIQIILYGSEDESRMRDLARDIKQRLIATGEISDVDLIGVRPYEISIEVAEDTLKRYGLTLESIAQMVKESSLNQSSGRIDSAAGKVVINTETQAQTIEEFSALPIKTYIDGARTQLGDIAKVTEYHSEKTELAHFNGNRAVGMAIYAASHENIVQVVDKANQVVDATRDRLPAGVHIESWSDNAYYLKDRIGLMLENAAMGALLIAIVLCLFMKPGLAAWVVAGIPVAFMGALAVLQFNSFSFSINLISIYGFILVLGIVVDDAIITAESCDAEIERVGASASSVIRGVAKVSVPATVGVLTTMIAFVPLLFLDGPMSSFASAIGLVVVFALVFALIETKFILPSHILSSSRNKARGGVGTKLSRLNERVNGEFYRFFRRVYLPFLKTLLRRPGLVVCVFIALLILTLGAISGGIIRFAFSPEVPGDFLNVEVRTTPTAGSEEIVHVIERIEQALVKTDRELRGDDQSLLVGFLRRVASDNSASFAVQMTKVEERTVDSSRFIDAWRQNIGLLPSVEMLSIAVGTDLGGRPISITLVGREAESLGFAADKLVEELKRYDGVFDIRNDASNQTKSMHLELTELGRSLGLTLGDVAGQVRARYHGVEVQRIQLQGDEIRVMVRLPEASRNTLTDLDMIYIRAPGGRTYPLAAVVKTEFSSVPVEIKRIDGDRAVEVSARADGAAIDTRDLIARLTEKFLPDLLRNIPEVDFKLSGGSSTQTKLMRQIAVGYLLALIAIYSLLAITLRSLIQPIITMAVVPFGLVGAAFGHLVMDMPISMYSLFGIIALSGVIVNDSVMLFAELNQSKRKDAAIDELIADTMLARIRAVFLTTITTFLGLSPMLLETSLQAQFLIPMAISLGFGVIFGTAITITLVPCLYKAIYSRGNSFERIEITPECQV